MHWKSLIGILRTGVILGMTSTAFPQASDPPDVVLNLAITYKDPVSMQPVVHEINAGDELAEINIPSAVKLTCRFNVDNIGGSMGGDGVTVEAWIDWPGDAAPPESENAHWVCIPERSGDCLNVEYTLTTDPEFPGKAGKGVYSIGAWVDRFDSLSEEDDANNYLGPVTLKVIPILRQVEPPKVMPKPTVIRSIKPVKK